MIIHSFYLYYKFEIACRSFSLNNRLFTVVLIHIVCLRRWFIFFFLFFLNKIQQNNILYNYWNEHLFILLQKLTLSFIRTKRLKKSDWLRGLQWSCNISSCHHVKKSKRNLLEFDQIRETWDKLMPSIYNFNQNSSIFYPLHLFPEYEKNTTRKKRQEQNKLINRTHDIFLVIDFVVVVVCLPKQKYTIEV